MDEYLDKVVEKEEESNPPPGIASAQDWGSSATPSKVGMRRCFFSDSFSWQENKDHQIWKTSTLSTVSRRQKMIFSGR